MGWLKPAESLLEPKGMWDTHRDPPPEGPVPEPAEGIVALGREVQGCRIGSEGANRLAEPGFLQQDRQAADVTDVRAVVDSSYDFVPVAMLLGVPLMFKRLTEEAEASGETLRYETKMYVYKLMTTPGLGLPLMWNSFGAGTKLPPVRHTRTHERD